MMGSGLTGLMLGLGEVVEGTFKYGTVGEAVHAIPQGGWINGNKKAGMTAFKGAFSPLPIAISLAMGGASMALAPKRDRNGRRVHRGLSHGIATTASLLAADAIGGLAGGPIGSAIAGMLLTKPIEKGLEKVLEPMEDIAYGLGRTVNHVDMGGNYLDTQAAYTMRARAASELGSSLLNARQYLGREAAMFHQ